MSFSTKYLIHQLLAWYVGFGLRYVWQWPSDSPWMEDKHFDNSAQFTRHPRNITRVVVCYKPGRWRC